MSQNTPEPPTPTPAPAPAPAPAAPPDARKRRWIYGTNVVVLILATLFAVGMVDYISNRYNHPFDCTTGGIYSLSPQTRLLLRQIKKKKLKFVVADMTGSSRVRQLLREYHRQCPEVKIDRTTSVRKVRLQIRRRYASELSPYHAAAAATGTQLQKFITFCNQQANAARQAAGSKNFSRGSKRLLRQLTAAFVYLAQRLRHAQHALQRAGRASLPHWQTTMLDVGDRLKALSSNLSNFTTFASAKGIGPRLTTYMKSRSAVFAKMVAQVKALRHRLAALKPLKFQHVRNQFGPNSLVVMAPHKVKIIPGYTLFAPAPANAPRGTPREFKGEQQLSSALLSLEQRRKPKVVFIAQGLPDVTGPQSPISLIVRLLKRNNFDTLSWAPPDPTMGPQPNASPTPPAMGKGVTWIIFPPPPPNPQMPAPPDYSHLLHLVKQHLKAGGNAIFLLQATAVNPMLGQAPVYPYTSLLGNYGISVKPGYLVVKRYERQDGGHLLAPQLRFSRFPNTPITASLQTFATTFAGVGQDSQVQSAPAYVGLVKNLPVGVHAQVFVRTPRSANIWAESQPGPKHFVKAQDIASPIPMAAMATTKTSRVAVIGNLFFLFDQVAGAQTAEIYNGEVRPVAVFPGNAALMLNTVRWVSGYANMIAVGPRTTAALRIARMGGHSVLVRVASVVGPAVLVLLIGVGMVFVRRRA